MAIGKKIALSVLVLLLAHEGAFAQDDSPIRVDAQGVMHWQDSGEEVALFGVNYSTPFAFAYRAHQHVGADLKQAIDADVDHLARLGLDAYRIHVWDREVSTSDGHLIENSHLDLLDYLLARLAEHGIKTILTPIAWWGAGYPEPDPGTDSFSDHYNKGELTTDPEARRYQANYLKAFIHHVNPYTGKSYRDDPDILAFEIINEPSHPGGPEETTRYINAMAAALREAGLRKPIFYNISQGYWDDHGRAVCAADIQGVSGQWYPTGLVRNSAVQGNMLPNVDQYAIPFADFPDCRDKARMVYEFDAADVAGSYMYPAMARSFRGAGFQWATQFAYDPMAIAYSNTEYQTHFLNLIYTPRKAISYMIAGEAFRHLPRGASFGTYPESERFGPFRVSYADDRSEMVTDTDFLYSRSTKTLPPSPGALRRVAGTGTSPVAAYTGTGAYFIDRLADGVWRLEVFPDAVWVADPFTRGSLARAAVQIRWAARSMQLRLLDLTDAFSVAPINAGNDHRPVVTDGSFAVRPGVYLLTRDGVTRPDWSADMLLSDLADAGLGRRRLGAFHAPPPSDGPTAVIHHPNAEAEAGKPFVVQADVVAEGPIGSATLFVRRVGSGRMRRVPMTQNGAFSFTATVPAEQMQAGLLEYGIAVTSGDQTRTFPENVAGQPYQWDFIGQDYWQVMVVKTEAPLVLFDARRDLGHVLYPHPWDYVPFRTDVVDGTLPGRLAVQAVVDNFTPDPHHFALRTFVPAGQRTRLDAAGADAVLHVRARSSGRATDRMEIALVEQDGTAWGATVPLTDTWQDVAIPLSSLRRVPLAMLPRPYPQFMPYLFTAATSPTAPALENLDGIQFATSAALFDDADRSGAHGFVIESIILRQP